MSVSLGLVGIVDKGDYKEEAIYSKGNFVLHEGSSWLALKDNLQGVTPVEGDDWKYLARGFAAEMLSLITAIDSAGIVGDAGAETDGQTLMDAIADRVANQLLEKKMMSSVQVNDETMVPTSALVYAMQQALTNLNSNLPSKYTQLSSPDYNSLITNGRYVIIASSTGVGTNAPNITVPIAMDVTGNNGTYCVQVAKSMMSGSMAIRELVNGTWGDWKYIALKSDFGGITIVKATDIAQFDESGPANTYRIMYLLVDNHAYISFDISWIRLQFKSADKAVLQKRCVYGNTVGEWS